MVPPNTPPTYGDMQSGEGKPGQNSLTPSEKVFAVHFILYVDPSIAGSAEPYFDPSYGVTYADQADFESTAVAGYATFEANSPGTTVVWTDYGTRKIGGTVNICFAAGSSPGVYGACY